MLELAEEQVQALERPKEPLKLVNPRTKEVFVLIRQEIHELSGKILKGWDDPEDDDLIAHEPHPLAKFAGMFKDDPLFADVLQIMAENRKKMDEDANVP